MGLAGDDPQTQGSRLVTQRAPSPSMTREFNWAEQDRWDREREAALQPRILTRSWGALTAEILLERISHRPQPTRDSTTQPEAA
jgi:hypothetical protein